jgi:hypothetical protein
MDRDLVFESSVDVDFWNCIGGAVAILGEYDADDEEYSNDPFVGLAFILADSMRAGEQWTLFAKAGVGFDSLSIEVVGTESVTVPAGTFYDCLKIRATVYEDGPWDKYIDDVYFAKDVGLVKEERISQSGTTDGVFLIVQEGHPVAELQSATVDEVDYP